MLQENIRNIAIIAHVDHGKTTLVDRLLQTAGVFRENQQVEERVLDSNDQERERGITILSKNVSIRYKGVKINVIDTPGHADFGGEVERVLKMADGVLLLVDAYEGPMPQTRFVLKHALAINLKPIVVINKIDRPGARPDEVLDEVFELMMELGATDEQLDFQTVYTSAVNGFARLDPDDGNMDMIPLLDSILKYIPAPDVDPDGPVAMQICTVDHSDYVGRIGTGRLFSGSIHEGDTVLVIKNDGSERYETVIKQLYTFEALGREEAESAEAGDIIAVTGVEDADIGDVVTDVENPVEMDPIEVEEPTLSVVFEASTSPLVGKEGDIVGGRQLKERLLHEGEANISMRIQELPDKSGIEVAGRGILHLSVLMETMRREGFEFQVGRPRVLFKEEHGQKLEPIEDANVETPSEYAGKIIELFGTAGGEMVNMATHEDQTSLDFKIPTRGIMGLRTKVLNASHGEAIFSHRFSEYGPYNGSIGGRKNGAMVAMSTDKAVAYALDTLQQRGTMFVEPGDECYEGMIVGESSKEGDMDVNVSKTKQLGNQRSSTADKAILLTPPVKFTLEEALEYIADDELVEVTPKSIRLRKRTLDKVARKKERARALGK
ncbi:MAG: translational GTPase TypA [Coriobacteriaceae bacterium]|jgi:GTP-binding protein|nr:translational GTPase TypA [Coriobacteriaceae bacterium]